MIGSLWNTWGVCANGPSVHRPLPMGLNEDRGFNNAARGLATGDGPTVPRPHPWVVSTSGPRDPRSHGRPAMPQQRGGDAMWQAFRGR